MAIFGYILIGFVVGISMGWMGGFAFGQISENEKLQRLAVKLKLARWETNHTTGKPYFVWYTIHGIMTMQQAAQSKSTFAYPQFSWGLPAAVFGDVPDHDESTYTGDLIDGDEPFDPMEDEEELEDETADTT